MRTNIQKVIFLYKWGGVKMDDNKEWQMIETIIEQWTEHYPPAKEEEMFTLKLTSYEIAEILSDFGTVSPGDVTRVLLNKGYRLVRTGDGEMKWLIKKEKTQ